MMCCAWEQWQELGPRPVQTQMSASQSDSFSFGQGPVGGELFPELTKPWMAKKGAKKNISFFTWWEKQKNTITVELMTSETFIIAV